MTDKGLDSRGMDGPQPSPYSQTVMSRCPRLLLLLLLFSFTAHAQIPVSEERGLAPTLGSSGNTRVVATDSGFLAFWSTNTSYGGAPGLAQVGRFSPEGVLERRATAWTLPPSFVWHDAASNGDQVLLAGMCAPGYTRPLCLARFSAEGDFLGLITIPIREPIWPAVASNGDGFLVVFGTASPREILAIPVSSEGAVGATILVADGAVTSQAVSVTAIGSSYYVTFSNTAQHVLARVADGEVNGSVPLSATTGYGQVRVESSGDRLLVITSSPAARFAIFDAALGVDLDWSPLDGGSSYPAIAPTSSGWILAMSSNAGTTVQPITRAGRHGPARPLENGVRPSVDAAGAGDRAAVVWTRQEPGFFGISARMAIFDGGGTLVHGPATISLGPAPQIHPAGAHGGGVTLVAWSERAAGGEFVVKTRTFDAAGGPFTAIVAMPFRGSSQLRPSVASDGNSFFVVWTEGLSGDDRIYGARVAADGRLLDSDPIGLFGPAPFRWDGNRAADVDWSGSSWIVVTSDERWRIVAKRVSPAGAILDSAPTQISPTVSETQGADSVPVLDCNGAECLVAWQGPPLPDDCRITCEPSTPSVRASRIASDATLLDAAPWLLTVAWEKVTAIGVRWNETAEAWLVSWSRDGQQRIGRNGFPTGSNDDATVSASGTVSAIPERQGWRIAWSSDGRGDLFHGWSETGDVPGITSRFFLTRSPEREWDPTLIAAPRPLALFQRESQIDAGSPTVLARFLDESDEPVPAEIVLTAERTASGVVRLSWATDLPASPGSGFRRSIRRGAT